MVFPFTQLESRAYEMRIAASLLELPHLQLLFYELTGGGVRNSLRFSPPDDPISPQKSTTI
jgi:hypothetical protein